MSLRQSILTTYQKVKNDLTRRLRKEPKTFEREDDELTLKKPVRSDERKS